MPSEEQTPNIAERKRTGKACVNCHNRKLRCEFSSQDQISCERCLRESVICEGRTRRRRRRTGHINPEVRSSHTPYHHEESHRPASSFDTITSAHVDSLRSNLFTANDALYALSNDHDKSQAKGDDHELLTPEDTEIVKDNILSAEMVPILVEFFFDEVAPFSTPRIPDEYRTPRLYNDPFLLSVICVLGARHREDEAFSRMHKNLWAYCESLLHKSTWHCHVLQSDNDCNKARGLIFGLLLLSEWIPGSFFLQERSLSPVDFVRRYAARCWLYVGYAVRLAQYSGLFEADRTIYVELHAAENALACRMGRASALDGHDEVIHLNEVLNVKEKSLMSLLQLMNLANKSIYKSRSHTSRLCRTGEYITQLQMFWNLIRNWVTEHENYILNSQSEDDIDISFELGYCKLYIFSISIAPYSSNNVEGFLHLMESEHFLNYALEGARSVIEHMVSTNPVNNTPLRWALRFIHAVTFLAKALLSDPKKYFRGENVKIFGKVKEFGSVLDRTAVPRYERYSKLLGSLYSELSNCEHIIHTVSERQESSSDREEGTLGHGDPTSIAGTAHHLTPMCLDDAFSTEMINLSEVWLGSMPCMTAFNSD